MELYAYDSVHRMWWMSREYRELSRNPSHELLSAKIGRVASRAETPGDQRKRVLCDVLTLAASIDACDLVTRIVADFPGVGRNQDCFSSWGEHDFPLNHAIRNRNASMARLLVQNGARVEHLNPGSDKTACEMALESEDTNMMFAVYGTVPLEEKHNAVVFKLMLELESYRRRERVAVLLECCAPARILPRDMLRELETLC